MQDPIRDDTPPPLDDAVSSGVLQEEVLGAVAEVMERQARVARAEAGLFMARRRLGEARARLTRLAPALSAVTPLPPLVVAALDAGPQGAAEPSPWGTMRERIVSALEASPGEVFTPARLARDLGLNNRDSIRNTLLVLAGKGLIVKVDLGQYRACKAPEPPSKASAAPEASEGGAPLAPAPFSQASHDAEVRARWDAEQAKLPPHERRTLEQAEADDEAHMGRQLRAGRDRGDL
jgi:hypothetical protein